ncbi:hypothetical protein D6783_05455 [Candidatus Woesearchaeota archaeon]|nr:MAG: hypothetical protein D6783_05455 [Candidatus Woesearchaeota archaeon]
MNETEFPYWNQKERVLEKPSIRKKAENIVKYGLVRKSPISTSTRRVYTILPKKGYNKRAKHVEHNVLEGTWNCDCQGFAKNGNCSHVLACKIFEEERMNWRESE